MTPLTKTSLGARRIPYPSMRHSVLALGVFAHLLSTLSIALIVSVLFFAATAGAQEEDGRTFIPITTDSPRSTLQSAQHMVSEIGSAFAAFQTNPSPSSQQQLEFEVQRMQLLFDLEPTPPIERREVGILAVTTLADLLPILGTDAIGAAPDNEEVASTGLVRWTVEGSELVIRQVEDGDRQGEFLFDHPTVLRLLTYARIESANALLQQRGWTSSARQIHGWMIPTTLVSSLPDWAMTGVAGDPIWKLIGACLASAIFIAGTIFINRWTWPAATRGKVSGLLSKTLTPLAILGGTTLYVFVVQNQIFVLGEFSTLVDVVSPLLIYFALGWLIWNLVFLAIEVAILNPRISNDSLDANLLRLGGQVLGIAAVMFCAVKAAEGFGIPVLGIAAGLGAGGLAFGLAAQSSIENLIGALTLYFDRPLRVGEFCRIAETEGTVESIGLRTTSVRTLDRTLVAIPNALVVKDQIINYSRRDRYLFRHILQVDYGPDAAALARLSEAIIAYVSALEWADPDGPIPTRAPTVRLGDWAIELEVLTYVRAANYGAYLELQAQMIGALVDLCGEHKITLALPVRRIVTASDLTR